MTIEADQESETKPILRDYLEYLGLGLGLFLVYVARIYSFLLFHTIAELMSIIIMGGIFIIGWNSRKYMNSSFFQVIGISFLYIAIIDLLHTLAYEDMNIFFGYDSNLPTSLWILARYWQASSLLFATLVINRKINSSYIFIISTIAISTLVPLIFLGYFPVCYIEGVGLTFFKIISEYIIIFIFLLSIIIFYINRFEFDKKILILIIISIISTMASELTFTLYVGVFGPSNVIGHLFKIVASFFIYKALIETGLESPYKLLFRRLKSSEDALKQKAGDLVQAFSETDQIFNASLPLRLINTNYEIIRVNDTFCELFRLNREEIISKKCYDLLPTKFCNTPDCTLKLIQSGKNMVEYELDYELKNGIIITLIVNSVANRDINGKFIGIIQNYTDITERKEVERILVESEEKFRTIADETSLGIVILQDGLIKYSNKALSKISGYSEEEMKIWDQHEFLTKIHPEDVPFILENIQKKLRNDSDLDLTTYYTARILTKANQIKWIDIFSKLITYQGKEAIFTSLLDITDKKEAEQKLKESEEKYRNLIEESPEGVWVIDANGRTILANQSMAHMLGYSITEMIGKLFFEFMDEESKKIAQTYFQRRKEGIREDHEFKFIHKNGRDVYTSLRTTPLFEEGKFYGAMAYVTDITEKKIAQEKIEDMARFPAENPNPVIRVSRKYVLLANKEAQKVFNIGEGSRIPKLLLEGVNETFSNNQVNRLEIEVNNHTYSFVITPIEGANYVNIYGLDITIRKKAEESLERFVSTVSHELRTPISVLVMSMDYLKNHKENLTPEIEEQLNNAIARNISLLYELVEDILTLSRIDEKKVKIDWKEYNPLIVIKDIINLMQPFEKVKETDFSINIDDNIKLFGDVKRIEQIFRIFIDNALKYSKENRKIEISAIDNYKGKYNRKERQGVLLQFKDNGIGISQNDVKHLFERFYRSEQVSNIPGTGLGLTIAKELVKLHDGEVYVDSELGKGSTFSIFLPRITSQP
ncbi:MAG: MASE3 domain-containing protein [Promethearchaeota archaeon]